MTKARTEKITRLPGGKWLTARVEAVTPEHAFCEITNGDFFVLRRGESRGCKDLFPDEFQRALPAGKKINVLTDGRRVLIEVK
jgi:hypothetical protein